MVSETILLSGFARTRPAPAEPLKPVRNRLDKDFAQDCRNSGSVQPESPVDTRRESTTAMADVQETVEK
jgi:hypothetical protein